MGLFKHNRGPYPGGEFFLRKDAEAQARRIKHNGGKKVKIVKQKIPQYVDSAGNIRFHKPGINSRGYAVEYQDISQGISKKEKRRKAKRGY